MFYLTKLNCDIFRYNNKSFCSCKMPLIVLVIYKDTIFRAIRLVILFYQKVRIIFLIIDFSIFDQQLRQIAKFRKMLF